MGLYQRWGGCAVLTDEGATLRTLWSTLLSQRQEQHWVQAASAAALLLVLASCWMPKITYQRMSCLQAFSSQSQATTLAIASLLQCSHTHVHSLSQPLFRLLV